MSPLKTPIIAASLLVVSSGPSFAENPFDTLSFRAIVKGEMALGMSETDLAKSDFTIRPEADMDIGDNLRLTAIGMARVEATDNLESGRPSQAMRGGLSKRGYIGEIADIELREFYLDTSIGGSYLRLGKQQIVWGQADGLRVLDVVNPFNNREFILDDFEDRRIPLWSLNLEAPVGDVTVQFIWLPDQTYDQYPDAGSTFAISSSRFVPVVPIGVPVIINPVEKPSDFFSDSDAGLRLSAFYGGWDLTLNYLYHYQDNNMLFQARNENGIFITPEYRRNNLIGGTFSNAFDSFTVRGEIGYSTDRYFVTNDISDMDGIHETAELSYVIGLDYSGIEDTFISGQIFQSIVTDHNIGMPRDKVDSQATLLIEREFMNNTIRTSMLLVQSLNDGDGVAQFGLEYDYQDNITLSAGADIFYGDEDGVFGQFNQSDRVTVGFEIGY